MEKYHDDNLASEAISKLRVLGKIERLASQKPDRLILGIIGYNRLIQDVIEDDKNTENSSRDDSSDFEKNFNADKKKILAALNTGYKAVKKRNFKEAIDRFEKLETQGISEGKFFKGMSIMAEKPSRFFVGLHEMVEAALETMNESLISNLQKVLEAAQKAGFFGKAKELKFNVDRNRLANYLRSFLNVGNDSLDEKKGAALLMEALRQYNT
jgi:hypothetical protein